MKTRGWLALMVGAFLVTAGTAQDDTIKKERAKLKGSWKLVQMEAGGEKAPEDAIKSMGMEFADDKVFLKDAKQKKEGTYKIDPSKKPTTIDITPADGPDKGKPLPGIYMIDGDTLKLCAADEPGQDRPTEFATKKGVHAVLMTFKREKP